MQKKLLFSLIVFGCLYSICVSHVAFAEVRFKEELTDWRFAREDVAGAENPDFLEIRVRSETHEKLRKDAKWEDVKLPHTWNAEDVFDDTPSYYRGVGWYRKNIVIPKSLEGKRFVLRFEAACMVATVWFNGQLLGEHKGSWTPFEFDITDRVKLGTENLIAVKVDNRFRRDVPPHYMDFNIMGGLHREVFLIATDPVHIASTRVTTPVVSNEQGVAALETEVRNDSNKTQKIQVLTTIEGPGLPKPISLLSPSQDLEPNEIVFVKQKTEPIANPKLWSPDQPNLYQVSTKLLMDDRAVDEVKDPLGFRWFRFDPKEGFFLNGKHLKLQGVNRHDDYPGLGWALSVSRQTKDLKLIKGLGVNFVRLAHYAQHPAVLDLCDQLGLLVWEEVPFTGEGNYGQIPYVGAEGFAETLKLNLRETIRRDRNHPSIIIWSMGNENTNSNQPKDWERTAEITRELSKISKQEDPTRPTAVASNVLASTDPRRPKRVLETGVVDAVDIVGVNIYAGWYREKIEDFATIMARIHKQIPTKPLIISEYGAGIEKGRHTSDPKSMDFSEEHGCRFHEFYWNTIADRPYIAGGLIWNVFDFAVECRVKRQSIPHMNQKGIFTYDRQPKDVYYYYLSQWTKEPMVYIVSHTWTERDKGDTSIRIYSNCDSVELLLDGKSLGVKSKDKDQKFVWDVPLREGKNVLKAKGKKDGKEIEDNLTINGK